jgi:hypothetical protein
VGQGAQRQAHVGEHTHRAAWDALFRELNVPERHGTAPAKAAAAPAPAASANTAADALTQGTVVAREAESGDDRRGRGRGKDDTRRDDKGGRRA